MKTFTNRQRAERERERMSPLLAFSLAKAFVIGPHQMSSSVTSLPTKIPRWEPEGLTGRSGQGEAFKSIQICGSFSGGEEVTTEDFSLFMPKPEW